MAKETLTESLSLNLPAMAQIIKKKGRGRDTILAHITPEEAKLLKKRGGRGSINPETGLLEFADYYSGEYMGAPDYSAAAAPTVQYEPSGGGYDPVTQTGGGVDWSTGVAQALPETPAATQGYTGVQLQPYQTQPFGEYATDIGATPTTPGLGIQAQLSPYSPGADVEKAIPAVTPEIQEQQGVLDKLKKLTGLSGSELGRLGLAGGLGLTGLAQQRKAQKQIQAAQAEQQAIAAPYQAQGKELMRQAQAGELTPQSQQAYQAAQAQVQQGIASRGGVGQAQAANQLSAIYQNLLNNQYNYGLQVSQIGDQYALGAIRTGQQLDQQLQTTSQNFYMQLASLAAGLPVQRAATPTV
jgi:hypothetical protein